VVSVVDVLPSHLVSYYSYISYRYSHDALLFIKYLQCFTYNIPHGDDAHMVFTALPNHVEEDVEDWFVSHMNEMTRKGGDQFMKDLPEMPDDIKKIVLEAKEVRTAVSLRLDAPRRPMLIRKQFKWYDPVVIKDVVKTSRAENPLGGYSICFDNDSDDEISVLMDVVLVSDKGEGAAGKKKKGLQKEHLTPLERNFQESIGAAHKILNEMHYMERREARMRHTAESTNKRIRMFSYLSVAILLGVTYLQVTYLRSYFKKKKLL